MEEIKTLKDLEHFELSIPNREWLKEKIFLSEKELKAEAIELIEDEVYYYRCCHKCGRVWQSLHCPHDGVQGTCPDCNTRALSFPEKECNCEFLMEVPKVQKFFDLKRGLEMKEIIELEKYMTEALELDKIEGLGKNLKGKKKSKEHIKNWRKSRWGK